MSGCFVLFVCLLRYGERTLKFIMVGIKGSRGQGTKVIHFSFLCFKGRTTRKGKSERDCIIFVPGYSSFGTQRQAGLLDIGGRRAYVLICSVSDPVLIPTRLCGGRFGFWVFTGVGTLVNSTS